MSTAFERKLRAPFEAAVAYAGSLIIPLLPRRAVISAAGFWGWIGYHLAISSRKIARANVELVFGSSLTAAQKKAMVRRAFRNVTLVILDLFWFSRNTRARVRRYVRFDSSMDVIRPLKPAISVTGHFGNWEILGQAVSYEDPPFLAVAAHVKNSIVDNMVGRLRRESNQQIAFKSGAVRQALRMLLAGGRVGLLLDQNILPREGGIYVDFFGLPVPMSSVAERLALKTGIPIVFSFCIPDGDGYVCYAPPPILPGSFKPDTGAITRMIAGVLEQEILRHPECWVWMYKRWKHYQPGEKPAGYPFYSKPLPYEEAQRTALSKLMRRSPRQ